MVDDQAIDQTQPVQSDPALESLGRLVGTWKISGEAQGQVRYEWMEGNHFLLQHVDIDQSRGLEVIGRERGFGMVDGEFGPTGPSEEIKSRFYGNDGSTLDYVYELDGDTLTIWFGDRGSPAHYSGKFSEDGNTLTGAWVYPGGGGYSSTATRVK